MDIDEIRKRISEIGKLAGNGLEENTKIIFQSLILLNGSGLVASLAFIGSILNSNFHTPYIPFVDVRPTVGGLFPELVLVNSHDGLSSYKLSAGLYRLICSNGLVAGENYKIIRVRKDDLFTVFNIDQENVIKGGLRGWAKDQNGYSKRVSTREIKSIDQSNALNKALWTLAEKMRELKKG